MQLSGAEIVWECLLQEGVQTVFGYPGGAILPVYDAMTFYDVRHVLVRHEQGAAHAAHGYACASDNVGVALATSGPGLTNMVTGLATALVDAVPMVCIIGQVATTVIGTDAFQEIDTFGVTLPVTKHNYLVTDVEDLATTIHEAFHLARTGRPGPVLIDLPKDVQTASTQFEQRQSPVSLCGYQPQTGIALEDYDKVLHVINTAERPVIVAGSSMLRVGAMRELQELAERGHIPVVATTLADSAIPISHPLYLTERHGLAVHGILQQADLFVLLGDGFDSHIAAHLHSFSSGTSKIYLGSSASESDLSASGIVRVVGEIQETLRQLLPYVQPQISRARWVNQFKADFHTVGSWQVHSPSRRAGSVQVLDVIDAVWEVTDDDAIVVADIDWRDMRRNWEHRDSSRYQLVMSNSLGTRGFALPASIGIKLARPHEEVWVVTSGSDFQVTQAELATVVQEKLPIRIVVLGNEGLDKLREWQELIYGCHFAAPHRANPDYCKLAEAHGIPASRVTEALELLSRVERGHKHDGPVLIDFSAVRSVR